MNPSITVLLATVFSLCALLLVGAGLVHTSWKRRRAIELGGRSIPSRILTDLQPIEGLLLDFVRHSPHLRDVLATLATADKPRPFRRIVHEIRFARASPAPLNIATHLVGAALGILFVAGLIRFNREGFMATNAGREVERRLCLAPAVRHLGESALMQEMNMKTTEKPTI